MWPAHKMGVVDHATEHAALGTIDIRSKGAVCDGQAVYDAAITTVSGTTRQVSSVTATFTPSDVGKVGVSVAKATGKQSGYPSVITAYIDPNTIQITATNNNVVAATAIFVWGTDDGAAINAAITAASEAKPKRHVFSRRRLPVLR